MKSCVVLFKYCKKDDYNKHENEKFEEFLIRNGVNVKLVSPIDFEFLDDNSLQQEIFDSENYDFVVLTSPRAASAFISTLSKVEGYHTNKWKSKKFFAVGPSTARVLSNLFDVTIPNCSYNVHSLCDTIKRNVSENEKTFSVLFPCGDLATELFSNVLKSVYPKAKVTTVPVYKTINNPHFDQEFLKVSQHCSDRYYLVFFSPSGIENCLSKVSSLALYSEVTYIAIGSRTSEKFKELNIDHFVCQNVSPESLFKLIDSLNNSKFETV